MAEPSTRWCCWSLCGIGSKWTNGSILNLLEVRGVLVHSYSAIVIVELDRNGQKHVRMKTSKRRTEGEWRRTKDRAIGIYPSLMCSLLPFYPERNKTKLQHVVRLNEINEGCPHWNRMASWIVLGTTSSTACNRKKVIINAWINSVAVRFSVRSVRSHTGKYVLLGTYGDVFRVRHRFTGQIYALKQIRDEHDINGIPATAMREASILRQLNHPNIIQLEDVFLTDDRCYFLLEYMDEDLKRYLDRNRPLERTIAQVNRTVLPSSFVWSRRWFS